MTQSLTELLPTENSDRFNSTLKILQGETNPDRLARWLEGENIAPIHVEIGMSDACNHNCPRCRHRRDQDSEISNPFPIINQVSEIGTKAVVFCGFGEPLLNPRTPEAMEYAKSKGLDIGLVSNGSVKLSIESIAKILKSATFFRISLDAATPETYQYSHSIPKAGFEKTLTNIRTIAAIKKNMGRDALGTFGIGFLTNARTKNEIPLLVKMFRDIPGVDFVQFRPYFNDPTPIDNEVKSAIELVKNNPLKIIWSSRYDENTQIQRPNPCLAPYFETTIAGSGKVFLCCHHMGDEQYEIGDLQSQTLKEIWNGEARKQVLANAVSESCPIPCRWQKLNALLIKAKNEGWNAEDVRKRSDSNSTNVHQHFL